MAALPPVRFGSFGAIGCQAWIYPERELVVVAATQTMSDLDPTDACIDALLSAD